MEKTLRNYLPELDGLRFCAFLLVFLHHSPHFMKFGGVFATAQEWCWIGVDLFFVLSSFLITRLLMAEFNKTQRINLKKFWFRRILRIWPLYYLAVALGYLVVPIFAEPQFNSPAYQMSVAQYLPGLFFFYLNFVVSKVGQPPGDFMNHLWTISVEEQFYLFWPFFFLFLCRINRKFTLTFVILLSILIIEARFYFLEQTRSFMSVCFNSFLRFDSFFIGAMVAVFEDRLTKIPKAMTVIFILIAFALVFSHPNIIANGTDAAWQFTLIALAFAGLVLLAIRQGFLQRLLQHRYLVNLGKISFGLYIYHRIALNLTRALDAHITLHWPGSFICSLVLTVAIATVSYYHFEKPFLKLKERFTLIENRPI